MCIRDRFYVKARVVGYRPAYGFVDVANSQCGRTRDRHGQHSNKGIGGAVVGGLVGGIVGNQIGSGSGRKIATVGGAVAGGLIGKNVARGGARGSDRRGISCRKYRGRYQEERLIGYDVTYQLYGERHVVRTRYEPSEYVRLNIRVRADEQ